MTRLGPFAPQTAQDFAHPVLDFVDGQPPGTVTIAVVRPKDVLGFKTAKIYLHYKHGAVSQPPREYAWDDELNAALLRRQVKSTSFEDEKTRFSLDLRRRLKPIESRYGDGYFNAILVMMAHELGFDQFDEVQRILPHIRRDPPSTKGRYFGECRAAISAALGGVVEDLRKLLDYSPDEAEDIAAGAVSRYLDERFAVTDRIRLGWA